MRSTPRMDVLCYMEAASELFDRACEDFSEGAEIEDVRARLELHRHAIDTILERI